MGTSGGRTTKVPARKASPLPTPPREREFSAFAGRNGLAFAKDGRLALHGIPIPWSSDEHPRWGTKLSGTWRGLPVATADVRWGSGRTAACTVAVVALRADLPPTLIGDRRQPAPGGGRRRSDVPLPAGDGIGKGFLVSSTDPEFAARLLSPQLREWLRSLDGSFDFWLSGGHVVAAARVRRGGRLRLLRPSELPYLLEAVRGFLLRVPPAIWAQHPMDPPDGRGAGFGWGMHPRVAVEQIVPTTPWYRRVRLLDRVSGAASAAGAALILVSFLLTWVTVAGWLRDRYNGIWWFGAGAIWALVVLVALPAGSGTYSLAGGRVLRVARGLVMGILAGLWLSWCVSSYADIRGWVAGMGWPLPVYHIGPGPRTGIVGGALVLAGAGLLLVTAVLFRHASRISVRALEATASGLPDSRADRGLAYVPAVSPSVTPYTQPPRTGRRVPAAARSTPFPRLVAAAVLLIALTIDASVGWHVYRRSEEFARYGVAETAHVIHYDCYSDDSGDGGDPCDVIVQYMFPSGWKGVPGTPVLSTLPGLDDSVISQIKQCHCLPILYDRRHPNDISTTTILRPATIVTIVAVIAFVLVLLFGRPIVRRRPRPKEMPISTAPFATPARPDRAEANTSRRATRNPRRQPPGTVRTSFGRSSRSSPRA